MKELKIGEFAPQPFSPQPVGGGGQQPTAKPPAQKPNPTNKSVNK
jgi:hypothetical protein